MSLRRWMATWERAATSLLNFTGFWMLFTVSQTRRTMMAARTTSKAIFTDLFIILVFYNYQNFSQS